MARAPSLALGWLLAAYAFRRTLRRPRQLRVTFALDGHEIARRIAHHT